MTDEHMKFMAEINQIEVAATALLNQAKQLQGATTAAINLRALSYLKQAAEHSDDTIRCLRIAQNLLKKEQ